MTDRAAKSDGSLSGRWHLIPADWSGAGVPQHRMDLVFHDEPAGLRGAVLSRRDGSELPLGSLTFDGAELRLKMRSVEGQPASESPVLALKPVADHFEGAWEQPGAEHLRLKLVRAAEAKLGRGA